MVGRRPRVGPRPALAVVPGSNAKRVADDEPAGPRPPRRLQDQRARQVAPAGRHLNPRRTQPEASGAAVERGSEHARGVRSGQAPPLDTAARSDQAVDLAVGEERMLGDGWKRAVDARLRDRPDVGQERLTVTVGCRPYRLPYARLTRLSRHPS